MGILGPRFWQARPPLDLVQEGGGVDCAVRMHTTHVQTRKHTHHTLIDELEETAAMPAATFTASQLQAMSDTLG